MVWVIYFRILWRDSGGGDTENSHHTVSTYNLGGGWCSEGGVVKGSVCLGRMATVWDGEVAGLGKALEKSPPHRKILVLTDSQATILAAGNAGSTGKHRTADLGSWSWKLGRDKICWGKMR